jgi:hypothetical protein
MIAGLRFSIGLEVVLLTSTRLHSVGEIREGRAGRWARDTGSRTAIEGIENTSAMRTYLRRYSGVKSLSTGDLQHFFLTMAMTM